MSFKGILRTWEKSINVQYEKKNNNIYQDLNLELTRTQPYYT